MTRSCQTQDLLVHKLHDGARVPTRGSALCAGFDLYCDANFEIAPGDRHLVSTGIALEIPGDCSYGRIAPRSGLAVKHGIQVGAGVVDADYRGEVKVLLFNHGSDTFSATAGDRIAQLIIERCKMPDVTVVTDRALSATERGTSGFGSTGN
tara:strand:+ start:667 stop:1119 length:453 start_codon:yes stop_codon:yes gene_type:complete